MQILTEISMCWSTFEKPGSHNDQIFIILMLHDVHQQLRSVVLKNYIFGRLIFRRKDPEAICQDGQELDVVPVQELDHDVHAARLSDRVLCSVPESRILKPKVILVFQICVPSW